MRDLGGEPCGIRTGPNGTKGGGDSSVLLPLSLKGDVSAVLDTGPSDSFGDGVGAVAGNIQ